MYEIIDSHAVFTFSDLKQELKCFVKTSLDYDLSSGVNWDSEKRRS